MANLTITAGSVAIQQAGNQLAEETAGEIITRCVPVYLNDSDDKVYIADANDSSKYDVYGLTLDGASAADYATVLVRKGFIRPGAILTPGKMYYLSRTAGLICEFSDLLSGDYVVEIGPAISTGLLKVAIRNLETQIP